MKFDRRSWLKSIGLGVVLKQGIDLDASPVQAQEKLDKADRVTTSVCPFCAVGCGLLVSTRAGKLVRIEGDPEHPINEGTLCSKGAALPQLVDNPRRLKTVRYRAPGKSGWEEKSWDWALDRIARRIRQTRDATFVTRDPAGRVVNRTEGIACLGGAALDNEECYAYAKLARALGVVYLEHQARI